MSGKSWIGPILGATLLLLFLLIPPIEPLTPTGMRVVGVFLFTVVWWATIGVGYPSLLCLALLALTGVMTPKEVFAASWGSYLVLFIVSVFGLAECLRISGFSRRLAFWFITRPFTRGRPWVMIAMFLLAITVLGSVMSHGAVCITFMTIAAPMLEGLGYKKGDHFAATLMMGTAWAAVAAYIMTPVGHVSNVLLMEWALRDTGYVITFVKWLAIGIPTGLLFYLLIMGYLRFVVRPDLSRFKDQAAAWVREESGKMGRISMEETIAAGVFLVVLVWWILPGVAGELLPEVSDYLGSMGFAVPPIIGAGLLCIIQVKKQPLLTFGQWMQSVPWASVSLIGAIMAIGAVIGRPETGISELFAGIFRPLATGTPFFLYRLIGQAWVTIQTNLMSNLVSATVVYGAMVPAAISAGLGNQAALGFSIFAGARAGFALPSATSTIALITGTGWVPLPFIARHGFAVSAGMVLLCAFVVYPLASFILS